MSHPENTISPQAPQAPTPAGQAFVIINLGLIEDMACFATLGPFPNWQEASNAACSIEAKFPGGVAYIHRNPHGCTSQRTIPEQMSRVLVKLGEARARAQGGAA